MPRLDVPIEVAFLGEPGPANWTAKSRLDAALVVLMPPERREKRVALAAPRAHVLALRLGLLLLLVAVVDAIVPSASVDVVDRVHRIGC